MYMLKEEHGSSSADVHETNHSNSRAQTADGRLDEVLLYVKTVSGLRSLSCCTTFVSHANAKKDYPNINL